MCRDSPPCSWGGNVLEGWVDYGHNPEHRESLLMAYASGPSQPFLFPSMYETKAVIIAMIITAVVSISVTIFCFQTKVRMGKALPWHPALLHIHTSFGFGTWAGMGGPRPLQTRDFPSLISSSHVCTCQVASCMVCVLSMSMSLPCSQEQHWDPPTGAQGQSSGLLRMTVI